MASNFSATDSTPDVTSSERVMWALNNKRVPTHLYLDLGANWANTLALHESVPCPGSTLWNVVAFEASPLVQPFLSQYVSFLNGDNAEEPENCLPRSGSTSHLLKYARKYGCSAYNPESGRECMWKCLRHHLSKLAPDPSLNSSSLVDAALRNGLVPPTLRHKYTLVPAAVSDYDGWTTIFENPQQLIRGGALPKAATAMTPKRIVTVDVARWLLQVPEDAYVFAKIDIEGAEHGLIKRLEALGSFRRLSRVSIECHGSAPCKDTIRRLRSWNVTLVTEREDGGMDRRSRAHVTYPIAPQCRCV